MGNKLIRLLKEERGTQIVEFILVFPLLWFLFVFSIDQFTIVYNKQKALGAAYEAGRFSCIQPTYKLAKYYANLHGFKELKQALAVEESKVELLVKKKWRKGDHVESRVTISFPLLASGELFTVSESYTMMIENAEE